MKAKLVKESIVDDLYYPENISVYNPKNFVYDNSFIIRSLDNKIRIIKDAGFWNIYYVNDENEYILMAKDIKYRNMKQICDIINDLIDEYKENF